MRKTRRTTGKPGSAAWFCRICNTVIFSAAFFLNAAAQQTELGFRAGVSVPHLTSSGSSEISKGYHSISGPDLALSFTVKITEQFSLEAGLEWSTQGGKKSGLQTIPASPELKPFFPPGVNTDYLYADFTSTVRLQYLMLPVLARHDFQLGQSGKWGLYVEAGIFGALLLDAQATASGSSGVYLDPQKTQQIGTVIIQFDSTGDIRNQLHKGNFGLEANAGVRYRMEKFSLAAECGGNYGFINLQKDARNGVNHTGALLFRLGIFYPF